MLNEKLLAGAAQLRAVEPVTAPEFDFLEGPKATRAAFFGLVGWLGGAVGIDVKGDEGFEFEEKAFLALFASLAVDLGIVFLTVVRDARPRRKKSSRGADGQGQPTPPRLAGILGEAKRR